ncbi:transcriptional attenuator, LytR family [Georgenia satyanarayanai]|uniref:Transcriptional attenuator, LytR family n=1 Tax=Georgenia satyanarayanai TaxID=860221 RepID=A0A2Y9ATB7_9MICO|nr:LCP family protein [Georgenia satyanarayanai]PYF95926.1 LytR family transcriptional attenuator [Georgenia satyanarayanai]SSA47295.1 transcriptional attenuator, LytR family [Georgenia satyanarayanai]
MPPSFAPGGSAPRPDARGARPVGAPPAGGSDATRAMPTSRPAGPERRSVHGQAQPTSQPPRTAQPSRADAQGAAPQRPAAYAPRTSTPAEAATPPRRAEPQRQPAPAPRRRRRRGRWVAAVVVVLLVLLLAWPIGLLWWANGRISHVSALSGAADTPGTTYLLAGSDSRADGAADDATEGQRSDTIMVLHKPASGPAALVSLPRDTYTDIPGYGAAKLNAAYSYGGPELLVETVEGLTGLTVDHYVEIGMAGVRDVVDAVGGVELCLDYDVDDWRSDLVWEAGCHPADGETALAFARMRYSDPEGDIGRTDRQRQLVSSIISEVATPSTILDPRGHVGLIDSALSAIVVDDDTGIIDLGRMALAFRSATGADGLIGPPPIADLNYQPGGVGSTVLLDPDRAPDFFERLAAGELTEADFE